MLSTSSVGCMAKAVYFQITRKAQMPRPVMSTGGFTTPQPLRVPENISTAVHKK